MQSSIANNGKKPSEPISEGNIPENEREKILQVLKQHDWHRNNAANALGMDRTTLWRKMKSFGITPP
ncbi:MAG: hypothetical protein GY846_25520 [Deltaproteobacteria bacterium]|nr:hypothetical protein [Deltaproteobacteria bacterium]